MLGSRRRHASTTRKDVPVLWPAVESDGERVRQPMTTNQRTTTDYGVTSSNGRNHRPTKRADADQSYAIAQSQYSTTNSSQFPMAAVAASSSSRFRTQDISRDTYDLRTYLKRKTTDRRSPRSSEERLYAPETAKQSRSGAYTRGGYPTTSSAPQGASQAYYAPISQPSHDPVIPQRERDRDKVETRERKRSEKEAARARIEEEKSRVRAYERERERERERRREEKERQRERERLKEQERRRDEKEQERLRRYKEKERARESRPRDINQVYPHQSASAQISAAAGVLKQYAESKLSSRHQQLDQLPSSSSNLALPQYGIPTQPSGSGARVQTFAEASRDDSLQVTPPHVPAKDKKRHRPHRDRAAAQQSAQESGVSSSEQEHSGRERPPRVTERRYTPKDSHDTHHSGPSGSENERYPRERVRKISRTHGEGHGGDSSRPVGTAPQVHGSIQPSTPVGSASFQHYVPQIVSIRAGQGPADSPTPQLRSKTPLVSGQARARDAQQAGYSSTPTQLANTTYSHPSQPQYTQVPSSRHPSQPQDSVTRLHNVLGTNSQAPLPPLPADASQHYPSAEQLTARPSQTPPSGHLPQSTVTPRSMAPSLPKDPPLGRSHTMPSSADSRQIPKAPLGYSPGRTQEVQYPTVHPAGFSNFEIYPTHRAVMSAEITLPTGTTALPDGSTQFVTVTQTTVKDLAAKFPLNEDMLTSASSSTLAGNTALPNQLVASSHTPPQPRRGSVEQPRPTVNNSALDTTTLNWVPTPASQSKPLGFGGRQVYDENDVPIPVPPPRTAASSQVASNPYLGTLQQASRLQPVPPPPRGTGAYGQPDIGFGVPAGSAQNVGVRAPGGLQTTPSLHPSNHSPARSTQQTIKGSPASGNNGIQLVGATPKHSPSQRLHGRNGSTDTVQFAPTKSSPNYTTKSVQPNTTPAQSAYVPSRTDTNLIRSTNITLEYPDNGRYRSQTPAYPSSAPPQQTSYQSTQTSIPNPTSQHTSTHHSRSMSNPVNQLQPPEPYVPPTRSNTIPQPSISTVAATAPSASAIVAAYRNRDHSVDMQGRHQDSTGQRGPPRTAPSPAPTVTGRTYTTQPSSVSRSGFGMSNNSSQPPRGQPSSVPRPPGGPPSTITGTHSRTQSDPQFSQPPPRVPVAGHLPTSAPPKAQITLHPTSSEQSLLKTPSSIAPSMLKSPVPPPSSQASKPPKTSSKKGIFGLFRSRSSPPKQDARAPPELLTATPIASSTKTRQRSSSQTTITAVAASVRNIIVPHPAPQQTSRVPPVRAATAVPPISGSMLAAEQERKGPPQTSGILAPTPVRVRAREDDNTIPSGRRSPGTKMVTAFRLLSKHHRTVSSASVEALDGTAANTVIGGESARSSTAGRLSPPLRDPFAATQDWRNKEEEDLRDRGIRRRRRPGVVFDVDKEFTDTETHGPAKRVSRGERR